MYIHQGNYIYMCSPLRPFESEAKLLRRRSRPVTGAHFRVEKVIFREEEKGKKGEKLRKLSFSLAD